MTATSSPTKAPDRPLAPARRWITWLTLWVEAMIAVGLALVVLRWMGEGFFRIVLFGSTDTPAGFTAEALEYQRWLTALTGALTVGWMVTVWFVVRHALARGERWAWPAVAGGIGAWFVLDSAASVAFGFGENAVLNVALVAAAIPPLVATRPHG